MYFNKNELILSNKIKDYKDLRPSTLIKEYYEIIL